MTATPLVVVTVGSDHHPFDRLIDWVDRWLASRPPESVRCTVQYGTSTPPRRAAAREFLPHAELQALLREAAAVVTQGGPMSIIESRRAGRVPVVVPRSAALGEHVDDHQQAFCRRLVAEGVVHVPHTEESFQLMLDAALDGSERFVAPLDADAPARVAATTQRVATLVDQLVAMRDGAPRVLLIAGSGRSGSTLLERALGEVPGVVALGETVHLWERGLRDDELCSCGERFMRCPFWSEVGRRAFGGWDLIAADELVQLRHHVVRTRHLPRLVGSSTDVGWRLERDRLARATGAIYRAVAQVTGARVIVDSSKMPAYAALLRRAGVDLRCAYVVRDPRGVAHSWTKTVTRPEVVDGSATMPRYSAVESALWWSAFDAAFVALAVTGTPTTTIRYEDFVAEPRGVLAKALNFAGIEPGDDALAHVNGSNITLAAGHLVAGNPMRFRTGPVDVVADDVWRSEQPRRDRKVVSLLTSGLRHRHGYRP